MNSEITIKCSQCGHISFFYVYDFYFTIELYCNKCEREKFKIRIEINNIDSLMKEIEYE